MNNHQRDLRMCENMETPWTTQNVLEQVKDFKPGGFGDPKKATDFFHVKL